MTNKDYIRNQFTEVFKEEPDIAVISPSRINIIGEHIDYLGGNVFPGAIGLYMRAGLKKDQNISFASLNFKKDGIRQYDLSKPVVYDKNNSFLNYVLGCYKILNDNGYKVGGFKCLVDSEIPLSSGLSSSAAFGVMLIKGLSELYGHHIDNVEIAKLFKQVENGFMNLKNGIMDQFVIANGKKDMLMLLNTSTLEFEYIPFDLGKYNILIINSKKPRNLIESKYNERVAETTEGLKIINEKYNYENICSIPFEKKDEVLALLKDPKIKSRVKYAIEEQHRVNELVVAIKNNDFVKVGKILNEGHKGLKEDYEVTSPELDFVNEEGNKVPGVLGVRMTGAGFGGCLIALIEESQNDEFIEFLQPKYKDKFGYDCEIYSARIVDGAKLY